jgi:hypothetical protein
VRTLLGVLVVVLILVPLAATAVRGLRRVAGTPGVEDIGRTTAQTVVEGLIVLAAVIVGVVLVVLIVD